MNRKSVKFTTDTGSPVTIISEPTFKYIGAKYNNKLVKHRITVANISTANILGYADVEIQIKTHHIKAEVIVVQYLNRDYLLGMEILETCPSTKEPIRRLRAALEGKTPIDKPKQIKKLDKIQRQLTVNTTSINKLIDSTDEPTKDFFEGIEKQMEMDLFRCELQGKTNPNNITIKRVCSIADLPTSMANHSHKLKIEAEIDKLRTLIREQLEWINVNLADIEEHNSQPAKEKTIEEHKADIVK
jgi:hypothetical protein